jgi:benzoate/toluate 1,2-dioxygenase beta subunit
MSASTMTRSEAEDILFLEARLLDEYRFDEWLALYHDDVVFWMPAWRDETNQTSDPEAELSLIYYRGKQNLTDRVWRLQSGLSNASVIPARVSHIISNVIVESVEPDHAVILSAFTAHHHDARSGRTHAYFGHYRHELVLGDGKWLIKAKTIKLMNDCIPTVADLYML